jgi:hypothetical protein
MSKNVRPYLSCVPFPKKTLYLALTVPLLLILILVLVYLWAYSFVLSLIFLLLFVAVCYFQAYCCAYEACPYIGHFCPAIVGIMPASYLAKTIYPKEKIVRSKARYSMNMTLAIIAWLALVLFPLYWICRAHVLLAAAYVACHLVYSLVFFITICPVCAIRNTCPGGKFQHTLCRR